MFPMSRRSRDLTTCATMAFPRPWPWYSGSTRTSQMVALNAWSLVHLDRPISSSCTPSALRVTRYKLATRKLFLRAASTLSIGRWGQPTFWQRHSRAVASTGPPVRYTMEAAFPSLSTVSMRSISWSSSIPASSQRGSPSAGAFVPFWVTSAVASDSPSPRNDRKESFPPVLLALRSSLEALLPMQGSCCCPPLLGDTLGPNGAVLLVIRFFLAGDTQTALCGCRQLLGEAIMILSHPQAAPGWHGQKGAPPPMLTALARPVEERSGPSLS
mmetsp:Transcript_8486/g.24327  ORF Transcript_8486/g.24327 Transcript_8486/m.24327 type:complete len:271 (-) Transcript_8486:102-914(-)